jgi:hypothetical protein
VCQAATFIFVALGGTALIFIRIGLPSAFVK